MENLKEQIVFLSEKLSIDLIGFSKLEYFNELESILLKQEKLKYKTSFQIGTIDNKVFKSSEYKSAIVIGVSYNKINCTDKLHLSSFCIGEDYHLVLKRKLELIKDYLNVKGFKANVNVDDNVLEERYLAYKAGLGFYGKNGLLINEKYGSFFFIGVILTNAIFEYDKISKTKCNNCGLCINACPTGAINSTGILDGNKCLSYLTQKKHIEEEEKKFFNNCVFGCDICSNICPYNDQINKSNNFESSGIELIDEKEFLIMSKEEYNKKYNNNASFWRGKTIIDRNIKLAIKNHNKTN